MDILRKRLQGLTGLVKECIIVTFNESHLDMDHMFKRSSSAFRHMLYAEPQVPMMIQPSDVFKLAAKPSTFSIFGLTVADLFNLDLATYYQVEEYVDKMEEAKPTVTNDLLKELARTQVQLKDK